MKTDSITCNIVSQSASQTTPFEILEVRIELN